MFDYVAWYLVIVCRLMIVFSLCHHIIVDDYWIWKGIIYTYILYAMLYVLLLYIVLYLKYYIVLYVKYYTIWQGYHQ